MPSRSMPGRHGTTAPAGDDDEILVADRPPGDPVRRPRRHRDGAPSRERRSTTGSRGLAASTAASSDPSGAAGRRWTLDVRDTPNSAPAQRARPPLARREHQRAVGVAEACAQVEARARRVLAGDDVVGLRPEDHPAVGAGRVEGLEHALGHQPLGDGVRALGRRGGELGGAGEEPGVPHGLGVLLGRGGGDERRHVLVEPRPHPVDRGARAVVGVPEREVGEGVGDGREQVRVHGAQEGADDADGRRRSAGVHADDPDVRPRRVRARGRAPRGCSSSRSRATRAPRRPSPSPPEVVVERRGARVARLQREGPDAGVAYEALDQPVGELRQLAGADHGGAEREDPGVGGGVDPGRDAVLDGRAVLQVVRHRDRSRVRGEPLRHLGVGHDEHPGRQRHAEAREGRRHLADLSVSAHPPLLGRRSGEGSTRPARRRRVQG